MLSLRDILYQAVSFLFFFETECNVAQAGLNLLCNQRRPWTSNFSNFLPPPPKCFRHPPPRLVYTVLGAEPRASPVFGSTVLQPQLRDSTGKLEGKVCRKIATQPWSLAAGRLLSVAGNRLPGKHIVSDREGKLLQ